MTNTQLTIHFELDELAGLFWLADMGYCKLAAGLTNDRLEKSQLENQYLTDLHCIRDLGDNLDKVFAKTQEIYEVIKSEYERAVETESEPDGPTD